MTKAKAANDATTVPGPELFLTAAWMHVSDFLRDKGGVPDVMILGRYADEELLFVFPSGQDRDQFARACIQEAANFGADIAMMAQEAHLLLGKTNTIVAAVFWCERGKPTRLQWSPIGRESEESTTATMGAISSMTGTHENRYLAGVFTPPQVH